MKPEVDLNVLSTDIFFVWDDVCIWYIYMYDWVDCLKYFPHQIVFKNRTQSYDFRIYNYNGSVVVG
jgi:hypothetical protein